jgi:hypothetical protein
LGFDWRRLFDAAVPKARHLKARHGSAGKASLDHIESRRDGTLAEHPLRIERNSRFPQHRLKLAFVGSLLMVLCLMFNVIMTACLFELLTLNASYPSCQEKSTSCSRSHREELAFNT